MHDLKKEQEKKDRIFELIREIRRGEYELETLPSLAYPFEEERQAMYYSNLRRNMESDMAQLVMEHHQQLNELRLIKEWKKDDDNRTERK